MKISKTFTHFVESEKSGGIVLILCTMISLGLANSVMGEGYLAFWHMHVAGLSVEHWVNDGLMAVFFLFVGLELERELYNGELSDIRNALLPICAAIGGIVIPAVIHFALNAGSAAQRGAGIPMATDIAFALGVLSLLGNRVPTSLKVFLTALAVMDDLGAIIVIALFYTDHFSVAYLAGALSVFLLLVACNRFLHWMSLFPYLVGGILMWYLMLRSGVHATIAGVLLAFAIPFSNKVDDAKSPSHRLEHVLHRPVAFIVLPIFALANTGMVITQNWTDSLVSDNSLGIMLGLFIGKPVGISLACLLATRLKLCHLPVDLGWRHLVGAGCLGGIGFTMSIFITQLAFGLSPELITSSKIAILVASACSGVLGLIILSRPPVQKISGHP